MAFAQFELKRVEALVDEFIESRRPPLEIRDQVDLAFRVEKQSVIIFEICPMWLLPSKKIEDMVAKTTFVKTQNIWKIYWQRADLKWHIYEPVAQVKTLKQFLKTVDEDEYCCFWG